MRIFVASKCLPGLVAFLVLCALPVQADIIVKTFHDQNNNGIQDQNEPLITGLSVEGFDELGNTYPFLDDGNGSFTLPALIPFNRLRVKVSGYGGELKQGVAGPTSVFFAEDGDEVLVPVSTGPTIDPLSSRVMIPCYEKGASRGEHVDGSPGFVSFPYDVDGVAQMFGGTATDPQKDATISQIGSTWGVAYQGEKKRAFAGTILKRHVGLGPEGPGGVYVIDYSNGDSAEVSSFNLHGMTPSVGPAINLGTVSDQEGMGSDLIRQIVDVEIDETMPYALSTVQSRIQRASYDVSAFEHVAKIAYGDLDLSDDGKTLWLVNLKQRSLIAMDVSQDDIQVTGSKLRHYPIENLSGLPNLNFLYRRCINAGSNKNTGGAESFTDPNRIPWDKNKFSLGGLGQYLNFNVGNTMNPATSTTIKDLYNTFRKGDFSYSIPIPKEENYEVIIHFAEPNIYVAGDRKFDIMIEGGMMVSDFDIVAAAGGSQMATTLKFQVQGTGPTLDIEFVSKQGNKVKEALVSGIEIAGESVMESGVVRPWGLKIKGDKGYLGVVTDASISQSREHLIACVLSFDPENVEAGFTEEVAFSLNYPRERASNAHIVTPQALRSAAWQAWIDDWNDALIETANEPKNIQGAILNGYAQPIVSDISFTPNGDMIISLMDRWAHQNGHNNYSTNLGDRTLLTVYASGDIIKAFREPDGSYFVERDNSDDGQFWRKDDGPSYAGEFFYEDNFNHPDAHHGELITGGQAILEGTDEVIVTVHNPIVTNLPTFPLKGIFTQGIHFYSTNSGKKTRAYLFVDQFILGKANGLGDMEFASVVSGAEVGNYVWCDANGNGVQDPTEFGIDGIDLVLHDKENSLQPVDTVTTSGGGAYLFTGLANDHCYEIRIDLDQLTALGYSGEVSPLGGSADTLIDSNGDDQMVPGFAVAMFCTGPAGDHKHDVDFGFLGPDAEDCTLVACDDGMNPMMIPCANFDSAAIAQCVDPSGMNVVSFYPTFNDADSMMNEITGSTIRTCNDSCIYARVMRPNDPMCFAIAKVTLNVIDVSGTGSISYAVVVCPGDPINLDLTLIAQGLDFVTGSDTFYSDMGKTMMIPNADMYTPPGYPTTVYFGATLSDAAGCMVMGSIMIDSAGLAQVSAGDSAIVCGFDCIDLTALGASFNANQSGATDVRWRSSSGAGTFIDDNTFANARMYCPDTIDVVNGSVTLYLEVLDDPCGIPVVDSVFIYIEPPGARLIPGPRNNVSCKDSFAIDPAAYDDFDGCRIVVNCVDTLVGDVVDYSIRVADCTDTTTVGNALNYDGVDDYVLDGDPSYISAGVAGEFTIEAWIQLESYGAAPVGSAVLGDLRIQGTDGGILLAVDPTGFVQIYRTGDGFLISSSQVPLDTWTHLALVQDATGVHLYVNGLLAETLTTGTYAEVDDTMVLGAYTRDLASFTDFFDGDMDEVRIWNHARTQGAISCDLSTDLSGTEDGLVAYYDFEVGAPCADNTGLTTLPDVTGNGHDGTLINFDLTGGLADPCESNWTDGALAPFVKYIVRTFEFRYNKQEFYCMDTIGIRGLNWDLFVCPPEKDTVYCVDLYRYLGGVIDAGLIEVADSLIGFIPEDYPKDENGHPSPLATGVPTAGGVPLWPPLPDLCDVQVLYKDWVFEGDCPMTIHRQWFIKNSCLGTFDTCDQWIMIADTSGPHLDFFRYLEDFDGEESFLEFLLEFFQIDKADSHECYHEFKVPPIAVVDSCSGVKQVKATVNGQTVAMEYNPETGYWETETTVKVPVSELNFDFNGGGLEDFFDQGWYTYEFLDSCHNRSTGLFGDLLGGLDTLPIIVVDGTPPVTICEKGVNVTVTDTTVWVPATTFDEGSWDNCGVGLVLARRADWATACGVNLCDSLLLVSAGEHGDSLWCAVLEEDKNINPVEAHYAKTIDWLCTDRRVCNYPILAGWAYDLIRYGTLDCIDHPYPVDEAYLDHILSGTNESELDFIFSLLLPCLKDISLEDLVENPGLLEEEISEEVFIGALEDLFKIIFARGNGFFNLFGLDSDGFGSFINDIGKQIGGGWSEEVPFCCEDACQEVTVEVLTMDYWCNWSKCWTTVRVEDKTPPKVECELFDVTVTCASYKTYYEDAVNAAVDGDFEPLQNALGRYDKVTYDDYGQAPDKTEFTIYELDCDSFLVTKDSLVYDEHFGYVWETFTYYRAEYDTTTRSQYNGQVADNCGLICIEEKPWISIDECGVGFVKRTFKFVGQCTIEGSEHLADTVVRHQTIWITNDCSITKAMFEVPKDTMVFDCGIQYDPDGSGNVSGAADPSLAGQATYIFDNDCRQVGIGYYDKVFRIVGGDGACWKIIRTWCFADWCYIGDEPQPPGWWYDKKYEGKYIQCEQKIILLDSTPPVCTIDEIPDVIEAAGCFYTLNTNVTVTDECGVLNYYWQLIDTKTNTTVNQGDGEFDSEVTDGFSITAADLEFTTYKLKVVVRDDCQNESLCEKIFTIDADQKPTPVCLSSITAELTPMDLDQDGVIDTAMATVWAAEYNSSSIASCGSSTSSLIFLIDDGTGEPALPPLSATKLDLGCEHVGTRLVRMYVLDQRGTWDYCSVMLIVQNNMAGCGGVPTSIGNLEGAIVTEINDPVELVDVKVELPDGQMLMASEDVSGSYRFEIQTGTEVYVKPSKNTDYINGVSTSDLVAIQKHILGKKQLDSWYKEKAADASADGKITPVDLIQLRKLILAKTDVLPDNTSWRFYDRLTNSEAYHINPMIEKMEIDFIGVKIGDVNLDNDPSRKAGRSSRSLVLTADDVKIQAGQRKRVSIRAGDFVDVQGYQFTMQVDPSKVQIDGMEPGKVLDLGGEHFNQDQMKAGWLTTSWHDALGRARTVRAGEVLFDLFLTASEEVHLSDVVTITSKRTVAEAYQSDGLIMDVSIRFDAAGFRNRGFALDQNRPNPFQDYTVIGFSVPEATQATLAVYDVTGKQVKIIDGFVTRGYHEWTLKDLGSHQSGVLYYLLRTPTHSAVRKMIRTE